MPDRGKDSNSIQIGLSRMWFAKKHAMRTVVNSHPIQPKFDFKPQRPRIIPMVALPSAESRSREEFSPPFFTPSPHFHTELDPVRKASQEFGLLFPEEYKGHITFQTSGTLLPLTNSSRNWVKKIQPFFPNVRVHHLAHTMRDFPKSKADPDIVMCSATNLYPAKRVWIEEWSNYELNGQDLGVLRACDVIMTPSLINQQDILRVIPEAKVLRINCPWPYYHSDTIDENHFLYMEKDSSATIALLNAWKAEYGHLVIVGSSVKLPDFARYISDTSDFSTIIRWLRGARALIDVSKNNYYASGSLSLAKSLGVPVISNNYYGADYNNIVISQDRAVSHSPTANDIEKALDKFMKKPIGRGPQFEHQNHAVNESMKKLLRNDA